MKTIKIGNKLIGDGYPSFIIAEIGYNFETTEQALKSIDLAKKAGADAVKFQTFRANTVVTKDAIFPTEAGGGSQYEEFAKFQLSDEAHYKIFEHAKKKGIPCFSTPAHPTDVDLLEKIGTQFYKVGSDDLVNLPFLKYVAERGKPMIVSTGMATLEEVDRAVWTIYKTGNCELILLHCVSNYPIEDLTTVNLKAIQTMKIAYQIPVGFSDHTTSVYVPIAAVAMGANVIEKHFTIDKDLKTTDGKPIPDAFFSADPRELKQIVTGIREIEKAIGNGMKQPASIELDMRSKTRKSIIAIKDIKIGEKITEKNIDIKRPFGGIEPMFWNIVLGREARVDIKKDEAITWDKI